LSIVRQNASSMFLCTAKTKVSEYIRNFRGCFTVLTSSEKINLSPISAGCMHSVRSRAANHDYLCCSCQASSWVLSTRKHNVFSMLP